MSMTKAQTFRSNVERTMRRPLIMCALLLTALFLIGCSKAEKKTVTTADNANAAQAVSTPANVTDQGRDGASVSGTPPSTAKPNSSESVRDKDDAGKKSDGQGVGREKEDDERYEAERTERGRDADDGGKVRKSPESER